MAEKADSYKVSQYRQGFSFQNSGDDPSRVPSAPGSPTREELDEACANIDWQQVVLMRESEPRMSFSTVATCAGCGVPIAAGLHREDCAYVIEARVKKTRESDTCMACGVPLAGRTEHKLGCPFVSGGIFDDPDAWFLSDPDATTHASSHDNERIDDPLRVAPRRSATTPNDVARCASCGVPLSSRVHRNECLLYCVCGEESTVEHLLANPTHVRACEVEAERGEDGVFRAARERVD